MHTYDVFMSLRIVSLLVGSLNYGGLIMLTLGNERGLNRKCFIPFLDNSMHCCSIFKFFDVFNVVFVYTNICCM